MADGRIIIDTEIDDSGAKKGLEKTVKSARSQAATLAAEYKKQGMSASEAMKKAWSEIERDSDAKSKQTANNWNNNLSSKLGSLAKTGATAITGLVAAASVAVTGLTTVAIKQYAEYEQLVGGVETLFKDSRDIVMKYADDAYKTAGLSANDYMSTITGFSASLLQGLGGDTKKAAEIGNKAVTDMSDNANKMGTSMESIQNAYQGFAKQNYTMLDNLKLGYGGTKEEMQRLLVDAGKLSGMEYSIGNFSDIIEAIHVVQTELGITGTTALEASETISGSFGAMKSAWKNMLTAFADDNADFDTVVGNLVTSISTFGKNILPRIKTTLEGIGIFIQEFAWQIPNIIMEIMPSVVDSGIEVVGALVNSLVSAAPMLIDSAVNIIKTLVNGIKGNLPSIVSSAMEILNSLVDGIVEVLPMLLELGLQMLITLGQGIASNLPALIPTIINLMISMCDMIIANLPLIIDVAIDIIMALVQGFITALPTLIAEVPRIINSFADAIYGALPTILKAGIDILLMLIKGLIDSIPTLIANIPQIIMAIVNVITLYNWSQLGKNLITWLGDGLTAMKGNVGNIAKGIAEWVGNSITNIFKGGLSWGKNLISSMGQGFSSMMSFLGNSASSVASGALNAIKGIFSGGVNIGKDLIKGIWNGISSMGDWILNLIGGFAGSIIDGIKGFFKIKSPSRIMRDEVGKYLVQGIGVGVDVETPNLQKDIDANMSDLVDKMTATVNYETAKTSSAMTAGVTKSVSNSTVTNNNDNGVTLHIEKFENNTDDDVETLAEEIAFIIKNRGVWA